MANVTFSLDSEIKRFFSVCKKEKKFTAADIHYEQMNPHTMHIGMYTFHRALNSAYMYSNVLFNWHKTLSQTHIIFSH